MKEAIYVLVGILIGVAGYAFVAPVFVQEQEPSVGAVSGPDLLSPYFNVNGWTEWPTRQGFASATTTVCAIKSPAATSTLALGSGVRLDVSSTTASTVTVAKAATAFATTTPLFSAHVAANARAAIAATTTTNDFVFAPNTWLVVGMAGGIGSFSPSGVCQAKFVQL
jgi:hypothetical protein